MPMKHSPVRARDLRTNIQELGFEKGVVTTLEMFFDEWAEARQHQREMVEMLGHCIDRIGDMMAVGESVTQKLDQMRRDKEQNASE